MKRIFLAGAALAALCTNSNAATVVYDPLPAGGSYFSPTTTSFTLPFEQGVTGSTDARTSPFLDTTTPYSVVEANGSATFGSAYGSGSFGAGSGTFSFVWGTPDSYNTLSFFSSSSPTPKAPIAVVSGTGDGSGSFLATVSGLGSYDSVKFDSGQNAFEFAALSPVPLPAALPMFGGALLALSGLAMLKKRGGKGVVAA